MLTRILTAIVLIAAVLIWLYFAPYPFFTMGALFIYMVGAYEMGPILGFKNKFIFLFLAVVAASLAFYIFPPGLYEQEIPKGVLYFIIGSSVVWLIMLPLLKAYPDNTKWHSNKILVSILGLLLLLPFLLGLLVLRADNYQVDFYAGANLVLAVMALVWAADSGAYFTGYAVGKTKLLEAVSPKKTREGLYGGLALAFLFLVLLNQFGLYSNYANNEGALMMAGFFAIVFSVVGDLVESMLKRIVGIKDSGKIFPGHGGMLDRIDSQLAAIPVFISVHTLVSGAL